LRTYYQVQKNVDYVIIKYIIINYYFFLSKINVGSYEITEKKSKKKLLYTGMFYDKKKYELIMAKCYFCTKIVLYITDDHIFNNTRCQASQIQWFASLSEKRVFCVFQW
jgi:hypothetical protein